MCKIHTPCLATKCTSIFLFSNIAGYFSAINWDMLKTVLTLIYKATDIPPFQFLTNRSSAVSFPSCIYVETDILSFLLRSRNCPHTFGMTILSNFPSFL